VETSKVETLGCLGASRENKSQQLRSLDPGVLVNSLQVGLTYLVAGQWKSARECRYSICVSSVFPFTAHYKHVISQHSITSGYHTWALDNGTLSFGFAIIDFA
jgi:hypothetical protein